MKDYQDEYKFLMNRWSALSNERSSWMSHWRELTKFFSPRSGQFLSEGAIGQKQNNGAKMHTHILDNSPLRSVTVATAGLMAGMTSPARPWFRLQTPDPQLNKQHRVRQWLSDVEDVMRDVFLYSNTYRAYRRIYKDLVTIGTGASFKMSDGQDVVRHYTLAPGEYCVGVNEREVIDTLYRQFQMTVDQLVSKFGYQNCSTRVKNMYDSKNLTAYVPVMHAIEPRRERDPFKIDNVNMPWKSCYLEIDSADKGLLSVSGFRHFPGIIPRWEVEAHDHYGVAPAMSALGDNKQLQQEQYRKSQGIDYQTQPPLQVPSTLVGAIEKGPGGITMVDAVGQGIKSAWDVELNLEYLLNDIRDVRARISAALFEDLFLMFTMEGPGVQPKTAEEIAAKKEEKLLMIGPVLENLQDEMLTPEIESTFIFMLQAGLVPPAPPELHNQPLVIKFVSILAQAQRLIGVNSVDRMIGTVVNMSAAKPQVLDKLDGDAIVDYYADVFNIDPDLIVGNDQVAIIRQQRAAQQAKQQAMEAAPAAAQTAKTLGETNVQGANAAVNALSSLGG